MDGKTRKVCRLCLKVARDNFKVIEDITREIFEVLLLKVNLSVSEEPAMCEHCKENIQRYYDFKSSCLLAEDQVFPFISDKMNVSVDLKKVYFSLTKNVIPLEFDVCRFCIQCIRKSRCTTLDMMKETKPLAEEMLAKCLPEKNLEVIKDPVICAICMETLEGYFNFMMNVWNVEDKIDGYMRTEGTSSKGLVSLNDVVLFMLQFDVKYSHINVVKMEERLAENGENEEMETKGKLMIKLEQQELIIKSEGNEKSLEGNINSDRYGCVTVELNECRRS